MPARDVSFADNEITLRKPFHMIANIIDNADKLVADRHRHRDGFLRPRVPVIDVDVSPADGSLQDPDAYIVSANFRNRSFFQP